MIEKQITTQPPPPYWGNYAILNNNHPVMRTACCGFCGALLNFSALIKMKSQISQQLLSSGRMTCRLNFGEIIFFFFFFLKSCGFSQRSTPSIPILFSPTVTLCRNQMYVCRFTKSTLPLPQTTNQLNICFFPPNCSFVSVCLCVCHYARVT